MSTELSSFDQFFHSGMCWAFHIADKLQKLGKPTIRSCLRIIDPMSSPVRHGKPSLRPLSLTQTTSTDTLPTFSLPPPQPSPSPQTLGSVWAGNRGVDSSVHFGTPSPS